MATSSNSLPRSLSEEGFGRRSSLGVTTGSGVSRLVIMLLHGLLYVDRTDEWHVYNCCRVCLEMNEKKPSVRVQVDVVQAWHVVFSVARDLYLEWPKGALVQEAS